MLRQLRFEPRASFEVELLRRVSVSRPERDDLAETSSWGLLLGAAGLLGLSIFLFWGVLLAVISGAP